MSDPLVERLRRALLLEGPTSAAVLMSSLAVSQPTVSRLLARLGDDVLVVGRGRSTRYALRRRILGVSWPIPVVAVNGDGVARQVARLHPVEPRGFWCDSPQPAIGGFSDDLPWWLADLRPAGFLGRLLPRRHPELSLPTDVRQWSSDDVLRYATRHGHDTIGNLIVGDDAFTAMQATVQATTPTMLCPADFPARAMAVLEGGQPGSSAGGEQPKFTGWTTRSDGAPVAVLVKWSPPLSSTVGRRVADLLRCEHHALAALRAIGLPAAHSAVHVVDDRACLVVERFDRLGTRGRQGVVSLAALDDGTVGASDARWPTITEALWRHKRLSAADHRRTRVAWAFGRRIGNTDMHRHNLSVMVDGDFRLSLAPIYDMLPMCLAPMAGEVRPAVLTSLPLVPGDDDIAADVEAAVGHWLASVAVDDAISDDVREAVAVGVVDGAARDRSSK